MPPKKELLIAAAYEAFNARDIDAVLAMMHPDVISEFVQRVGVAE